ncbi:MAG: DUF1398 family protein [Acidobacteria bacterium]|nr:DUF1398 family protein [Acidobacteriota bacterium]
MNTAEVHVVMAGTQNGTMTFPQVVGRLLAVGVESYFVDYLAKNEVVYTADEVLTEPLTLDVPAVADTFSREGIVAAIRGAQADTIRYPEFVKQAAAAGVAGYWAFLSGQKVIYFGRRGEMHIEEFPRK